MMGRYEAGLAQAVGWGYLRVAGVFGVFGIIVDTAYTGRESSAMERNVSCRKHYFYAYYRPCEQNRYFLAIIEGCQSSNEL